MKPLSPVSVLLWAVSVCFFFVPIPSIASDATPGWQTRTTKIDLPRSMNLAGQNLLNMLSPERNYLPDFLIAVDHDYKANVEVYFPSHNIGRWWEAILPLRAATGFKVPPNIDTAMYKNLAGFFNNPDNLCLHPLDMPHEDADLLCFHSQREGLMALVSLIEYRHDKWAVEQGHRMLQSIDRILLPEDQWRARNTVWDVTKTERFHHTSKPVTTPLSGWNVNVVGSEGRLLEPLVMFYELTGDPLALELADKFARFDLTIVTRPDGRPFGDSPPAGHDHSYQGTLRGLLRYGELTGQRKYIDDVAATYRVTIPMIVKKSGFAPHNIGQEHGPEVSSVADAAEIALWLGERHGYTEYLDDVEKYVRARLIPAQITESPKLLPKIKGTAEENRAIAGDGRIIYRESPPGMEKRIIGAIGGVSAEPHGGKWSVTDVTSAALRGLVDIYNHVAIKTDAGLTVYLHFDYEDKNVKITSVRAEHATVTIVPKSPNNVLIRISGWTPKESVRIEVNDKPAELKMIGRFAFVPRQTLPCKIVLTYGLPISTEVEKTAGVDYKLTWRGDEIIGICPNTTFYPFYPTTPQCD